VPILVGGTGLYLRTLLDGIAPVPAIDPAVRDAVRGMPVAEAYAALLAEDPGRAARLSPTDRTRVARALEVVRSTGRPLGEWQAELSGGIGQAVALHTAVLLPPRDWLYERCDRRFAQMLERGAPDEVSAAGPRTRPRPAGDARHRCAGTGGLAGGRAEPRPAERGAQATRNYAKRQFTWFRNQSPPDWHRIEAKDYDIERIFASLLRH
jgi:tRNA dimethylallyltransferase